MKKNLIFLAFAAAVAAVVVSCSKESGEGMVFRASAEQATENGNVSHSESNGGSHTLPNQRNVMSEANKLSLSGHTLLWSADDTISIYDNASSWGLYVLAGSPGSSRCDYEYYSGSAASVAPFQAVTPASMHTAAAEVTLPAVQSSADGSLRRLPMYAYGTDENLHFYNLCGVVRFRLSASEAVSVSSIAVTANRNINGVAAISGSGTSVSLGAIGSGSATTTLSLGTAQSIASAKDFYMYLPAGSYSTFEITVTSSTSATCTKTASSSIAVERGKITTITLTGLSFGTAMPAGALSGEFSVASGRTVHFSQGNLQYQASTGTWRFATNQWDCIGSANSNISSSYSGWIDLFGWGTSGWNSGATCYQPWSISTSYSDYYPGGSYTNNLTGAYANADWGVYNAISNGGNAAGLWRTLTQSEWYYLINTRANASSKWGNATVAGVNGVILLPDSFTDPMKNNGSGAFVPQATEGWSDNVYSADDWTTAMQPAGAMFLPAAGYRNGTTVNYVGSYGYYWSATYYDESGAYGVSFGSGYLFAYRAIGRYLGLSVRLVRG